MAWPTLFTAFIFFSSLVSAFEHPGLLVNSADIARIQKHLTAKEDPWLSSWNALISSEYANASYTNHAVSVIYRGSDGTHAENTDLLWDDVAAAFNLALRWRITEETQYAAAATSILVAWGNTLTEIGGDNDAYLAAGLQGYEFANAAELLRNYSPFMESGYATFTKMMEDVFLPMNMAFLNHQVWSETVIKHYFASWELCNMASVMAIGVLTDNQTAYDYAVNYFKNGAGNGAINNAVSNLVEEPVTGTIMGQGQESGRDQGHSALDWQLLAAFAQQAYNQGDDLFAYNNSRILQGAEYFARYNLGYEVPFETYTNTIVTYTQISSESRGSVRPNWELLWSHYGQIKGLDAPWTKKYLNNTLEYYGGYEKGAGTLGTGSGNFDGLGWGSLLYHLADSDVAAAQGSASLTSSTSSATSSTISSNIASFAFNTSTITSSVETGSIITSTTATSSTSTALSDSDSNYTSIYSKILPSDSSAFTSSVSSQYIAKTTSAPLSFQTLPAKPIETIFATSVFTVLACPSSA